jgi:hypothetical protein
MSSKQLSAYGLKPWVTIDTNFKSRQGRMKYTETTRRYAAISLKKGETGGK